MLKLFRAFVVALICPAAALYPSWASADCLKKGLAVNGASKSVVGLLQVPWYYNWSIWPFNPPPSNASFVPMIHGLANVGTLAGPVPIVLGFNEPDGCQAGQTCITVSQAIAAWPQVQSIAQVVGAPAIGSSSAMARAWLTAFMSGIRQNKLQVDFIPIHWYGPPDPARLLTYVDSVYAEFGLPVWVTEFAVKNNATNTYTPEQALAYMQAVLPALESRSYVGRFAWFGAAGTNNSAYLAPSRLVDAAGALTTLGQAYASFPESGTTLCGQPNYPATSQANAYTSRIMHTK